MEGRSASASRDGCRHGLRPITTRGQDSYTKAHSNEAAEILHVLGSKEDEVLESSTVAAETPGLSLRCFDGGSALAFAETGDAYG